MRAIILGGVRAPSAELGTGRSSPSGLLSPSVNTVLQGAVNAAREALACGLALKRAPIRSNAVSVGLIATPLWAGMTKAEREAVFASAEEYIGKPPDVANAVFFLASALFSTGAAVMVDGDGTMVGWRTPW